MDKRVFMISGLPRSGSTVLASMLSQHPDVYTTTTSPVLDLINAIKTRWPGITGHLVDQDPRQLNNIVHGVFESSYRHVAQTNIIDKHREWPRHIKFLTDLHGQPPKIICTVRDIPEILSSFILLIERNNHTITYIDQELIDTNKPVNNQNRCRLLWEKYINIPWTSLKLGWEYDPTSMLFLDYGDIVDHSVMTVDRIFKFLEIPNSINLNHAHLTPKPENDRAYGLMGLHDIRPELKRASPPAEQVIGTELTEYYRSLSLDFWNKK
jgi:sulfotransferase